jgi:hypothetical protein
MLRSVSVVYDDNNKYKIQQEAQQRLFHVFNNGQVSRSMFVLHMYMIHIGSTAIA